MNEYTSPGLASTSRTRIINSTFPFSVHRALVRGPQAANTLDVRTP